MDISVTQVFMERDGMSKSEALAAKSELREEIMKALESDDYTGAEELLLEEGFEMDYFEDLF